MARALSIGARVVPAGSRDEYFRQLAQRQVMHASAGCNFWVFERDGTSTADGEFVEFIEARDAATLDSAIARDHDAVTDARRYHETILPAAPPAT